MTNDNSRGEICRMAMMAMLAVGAGISLAGCVPAETQGLSVGIYSGDLACRIMAVNPDGMEGSEDFSFAVTLVVDAAGALTINDEPIVVGEMVTRSIPNADLAFEVLTVTDSVGQVDVTYGPRPTLPGIEVTGVLMEQYQQSADDVEVTGVAELVLTDVSGDAMLDVDCSGTLRRQ